MAYGQHSPTRPYGPTGPGIYPPLAPATTEGVIGRRFFAYLVDIVMIALFSILLWVAIAILGVITFGFGWILFAILPASGIIYSAITVGGSAQSTIGMRMLGLRVFDAVTGGPVGVLVAAVHALLFYVAAGTFVLWVIDLLVGFVRNDGRLGHDLLAGVVVTRRV